MTTKERVQEVLKELPEDCTLEDVSYRLYVLDRIETGLDQLKRGEGIPNSEARARMTRWLSR